MGKKGNVGFFHRTKDWVGDKVAKGKRFAKDIVQQGKNELLEKPPYYTAVAELENKIEELSNRPDIKTPENKVALEAATALMHELKAARDTFDKNTKAVYDEGMSLIAYNAELYKFAETCNEAIHNHQPQLMAAPDWWNQLKAFISNVAEKWLGIKELVETKKSGFAESESFKKKFEQVKDDSKEEMLKNNPFDPN